MRALTLAMVVTVAGCERAAHTSNDGASADTAPAVHAVEPAAPPGTPAGDSGATKLPPVDEADSSFARFRTLALAALQRRDTTFLYAMLAPEIKNSFGGDDGVAGFKRIWKMSAPDSSPVWATLTHVLRLGGKRQGESFVAPYVFAAWPEGVDAFQHVAITSENAPAFAQPDANSQPVAALSHSILPAQEWQGLVDGIPGAKTFVRVVLPDGRRAWVSAANAYSPVSWRAFFSKRNNRWVMTLFVAGD